MTSRESPSADVFVAAYARLQKQGFQLSHPATLLTVGIPVLSLGKLQQEGVA